MYVNSFNKMPLLKCNRDALLSLHRCFFFSVTNCSHSIKLETVFANQWSWGYHQQEDNSRSVIDDTVICPYSLSVYIVSQIHHPSMSASPRRLPSPLPFSFLLPSHPSHPYLPSSPLVPTIYIYPEWRIRTAIARKTESRTKHCYANGNRWVSK